jgi:hypothetical protein
MLGQHPEMHGLPETHLFGEDTMEGWWSRASAVSYQMAHGLVRAVAEIVFGEQTAETVKSARGWLRRRSSYTSGMLFEELAWGVRPKVLIDKSPNVVYNSSSLERIRKFFPEGRFLHLVRNPRNYSESVLKYLKILSRPAYEPRERRNRVGPEWLRVLASYPYTSPNRVQGIERGGVLDPQASWYVLNHNIVSFLATVPEEQWLRVRGEDLLADPVANLPATLNWLGLNAQQSDLEEMMHPERAPYAHFGPPGARLGNDILFLEDPHLRLGKGQIPELGGPLRWRPDGEGFLPEVLELAHVLGYE